MQNKNSINLLDKTIFQDLVQKKMLPVMHYQEALDIANRHHALFWPYWFNQSGLDPKIFLEILSSYTGLDIIECDKNNIIESNVDTEIGNKLLQHHCLLSESNGTELTIITSMPVGIEWLQQWQFHNKYKLTIYLCGYHDFLKMKTCLELNISYKNYLTHQSKHENNRLLIIIHNCLHYAIAHHISDIHGEAHANYMQLRMRKDGLLQQSFTFDLDASKKITNCLKILSQCDVANTRFPQDGYICIENFPSGKQDARIHFCPTIHGEKWVIRLLPQQRILNIEELGFAHNDLKKISTAIHQPQGLILVTGPTGSGKTSTLYTFLQNLNQSSVNISTIEDPVEKQIRHINQIQTNHAIGFDFATGLRSLLRQDPDIIMIGEIRDKETADIALKAAQTGHLVFATLHSNSTAHTISRLLAMGFHPELLSQTIIAIIAQRLARKICNYCHGDFKNCNHCNHGYLNRLPIYEVMTLDKTLQKIIEHQPFHADQLEAQACEQGMTSLHHHAQFLIKQGLIDSKEMKRVLIH